MKKNNTSLNVITFKMQLPKRAYILSALVIVFCLLGIIVSVYRAIKFGVNGLSDFLKYPFLILIEVFCIVLVSSVLAKSQYVLDDKNLKAKFGIISNVFALKDITSVILDTDTKKMTVYLGEQFFVLFLPETDNHDFVQELRKRNQNIDYSFTLSEK